MGPKCHPVGGEPPTGLQLLELWNHGSEPSAPKSPNTQTGKLGLFVVRLEGWQTFSSLSYFVIYTKIQKKINLVSKVDIVHSLHKVLEILKYWSIWLMKKHYKNCKLTMFCKKKIDQPEPEIVVICILIFPVTGSSPSFPPWDKS